jgi:hypothetical protein
MSDMEPGVADAIEEVDYRWHLYATARNVIDQAQALTDFGNAFSDLRTWHPGYDANHGTLPWEREADA